MRWMKLLVQRIVLYVLALTVVGSSMPMMVFASEYGAEKPRRTYSYDVTSGRWNSASWVYNPVTKQYMPALKPSDSSTSAAADTTEASIDDASGSTDGNAQAATDIDASSETSVHNDSKVNNNLRSDAKTGDADVAFNTKAGGAKTGDASSETIVINSVHSTVGGENAGVAHFTADIYGNVLGDIVLGPAIKNATVSNDVNVSDKLDINNNTAIVNDLSLRATSGDANVNHNTKAGDATSGNAHTVASVLNLINTIIAANKSFVGTINIYGNLNGDILISPEFIPQLLASNADLVTNVEVPVSANLSNDQSIINNIKLEATTGDATVQGNTGAGSAKTGTATTNLTVLNLTGHEVNAENSLLVFVNVLGKWIGMIVDAPGATAAAFGSGVVNNNINVSAEADINNNASITNNIDLVSKSGDASVVGNTSAGNATTGNATASANLANISTSTFDLTGWFGVLFINVFGTWIGSFGVDTKAGTVVPIGGMARSEKNAKGAPNLRFGFIPKSIIEAETAEQLGETIDNMSDREKNQLAAVAASSAKPPANENGPTRETSRLTAWISSIMMITGFSMIGAHIARLGIHRWRRNGDSHTSFDHLTTKPVE